MLKHVHKTRHCETSINLLESGIILKMGIDVHSVTAAPDEVKLDRLEREAKAAVSSSSGRQKANLDHVASKRCACGILPHA